MMKPKEIEAKMIKKYKKLPYSHTKYAYIRYCACVHHAFPIRKKCKCGKKYLTFKNFDAILFVKANGETESFCSIKCSLITAFS